MSTAKKILSNTAVQVFGRAIMAGLSIVILKIISHFLSVEGYGMYTAVYEFLAFFGIAADLGLFTIAVREMSKGERDRTFIANNILGMRMSMGIIMMSLAVVAAFLIPAYEETYIPMGVAVASLSVFLAIMHGTVSSVLQVDLKMQYSTWGLVLGKVISLAWMIAVIFYFYAEAPSQAAFNQLMVAGVVGNLFSFLFTFYFVLKVQKIRPQFAKEYWKEVAITAAPYGAALILNMVYFRVSSLMLLFMNGPKELGYLGPAMRILEILNVIPVYFMNSVLPVLSRALREGSGKAERIVQLAFNFLFMAALPMTMGLYILAYPIIFLITQPEFLSQLDKGIYGSDYALQILVLAMFFMFLNSTFNYSLIAVGKQAHLLWINGSAALINIALNLYMIPRFGFRGTAWTGVFIEFFILVASYAVARRYIHYRFDVWALVKTACAGLLMGAAVYYLKDPTYHLWGLQNLNVLVLSIGGAAFYGALLYLFGAIPEEFRKKIDEKLA
ncbi:MAG: flippase [Candidatus Gracilibacteria bacterium]